MKKINPKVAKVVISILSILLVGGVTLAVKDGLGDPSNGGGDDDTGLF